MWNCYQQMMTILPLVALIVALVLMFAVTSSSRVKADNTNNNNKAYNNLNNSEAAAVINILLIGSSKDTRDYAYEFDAVYGTTFVAPSSGAFDATEVRTELENILQGDDSFAGSVNVELIDRFSEHWQRYIRGQNNERNQLVHTSNLLSWFYWPYDPQSTQGLGSGYEVNYRWPNLRGEAGVAWDYIVLVADPYTIENMPGIYAQGVASIDEEVRKGTAETVLFMNWPITTQNGQTSVEHYRKIVHRVAQSGGLTVAPAAVAWQAAGQPPLDRGGAYLAAATLYTSLFGRNASSASTYNSGYNNYADTAYEQVQAELENPPPFESRYTPPSNTSIHSPFRMVHQTSRHLVFYRKASSTEAGFHNGASRAVARAQVQQHNFNVDGVTTEAWQLRRYAEFLNRVSEREPNSLVWGFHYQNINPDNDAHTAEISDGDLSLADTMMLYTNGNPNNARLLPRRILWAMFHQQFPQASPLSHGPHVSVMADDASGTYMYTLYSGRCPLDSNDDLDDDSGLFYATRVGYQTAWRIGNVQMRASGFQVLPSRTDHFAAGAITPETMTVQFRFPPQHNVTVYITSSNEQAATVTPDRLLFSPFNYNIPQSVALSANTQDYRGTKFQAHFSTTSQDVVYHGLQDSWEYLVNEPPIIEVSTEHDVLTILDGDNSVSTEVKVVIEDDPTEEEDPTVLWERDWGPDGLSFSDPTSTMPLVTFAQPGTYVLRVTVRDQYSIVTETVLIQVNLENDNYVVPDIDESQYAFVSGMVYEKYIGGTAGWNIYHLLNRKHYVFDSSGITYTGFTLEGLDTHIGAGFRGYGFILQAYLEIPVTGYYTFYAESLSGARLYIGGNASNFLTDFSLEINNNQGPSPREDSGTVGLQEGKHLITAGYYRRNRDLEEGDIFIVDWSGPGLTREALSADWLYYDPELLPQLTLSIGDEEGTTEVFSGEDGTQEEETMPPQEEETKEPQEEEIKEEETKEPQEFTVYQSQQLQPSEETTAEDEEVEVVEEEVGPTDGPSSNVDNDSSITAISGNRKPPEQDPFDDSDGPVMIFESSQSDGRHGFRLLIRSMAITSVAAMLGVALL